MERNKRRLVLLGAELKSLTLLSLPLILAQLAQSSMGFVDTLMAGRVSASDLAAVAIGSSIWYPIFLLLLGTLSALTPTISQAHGGGDHDAIKHITPQGIYLGLIGGLLILLLLQQADILLPWMAVKPTLIPLIKGYLHGVSWGFPAIAGCFALRYCSEGLSLTRPSMLVSFFGLAINIIANYVLVFGKLGFPAMGGIGCGAATALSMWAMFIGMLLVFWRGSIYRNLHMLRFNAPWCWDTQKQLLKLGLPIGGGLFIECSIFAIIALLLARFGAQTVAAHQIALNFTAMIFMVPLSIATAISVRVSYNIGKQRRLQTLRSVHIGILTAFSISLLSCAAMALFPEQCVSIYNNNSQLLKGAASLLFFSAIYQIPDAIQVACAGALRGCKDTKIPMIIQTISYWVIGLPVGCYLGLHLQWGARGFWIGLICGLSSAAAMLGIRLKYTLTKLALNRENHH
ncbi:MAG: MATE family efflux transporter [Thermodesulfobacteriota bacterium]|nr:MATE family efflux transporter [Thermodesulfobacteriota bacterium]